MAADAVLPPLNTSDDPLSAAVRARSFLALLATGRSVPAEALGVPAGMGAADVREAIDGLRSAGRITVDDNGINGSLGLSVVPCRHRIDLPQGRRYTWCALDAVGILGALGATGSITSTSPDGEPVAVRFARGRPIGASGLVILLPERGSGPTVHTWCPLVNFFAGPERARAWSDERELVATVVPLAEATTLATGLWRAAIDAACGAGAWLTDNRHSAGITARSQQ